jgi:hypothetical protein
MPASPEFREPAARIGRPDGRLTGNLGSAKIGLGAFFHCLNCDLYGVTEGDRVIP